MSAVLSPVARIWSLVLPLGVMEILRRSNIPIEGANAVVIGRSDIVGKPMALLLMHANATRHRLPLENAQSFLKPFVAPIS